jgi:hypothetical protein
MKIEIITDVVNGKFKRNLNRIQQTVKSLEGKEVKIVISEVFKKRSERQNNFYWGVVIPIMQNTMLDIGNPMDIEDIHLMLRVKFLKQIISINEETGEVAERVKSTTELSTIEFMDYIAKVRFWAIDFFGVEIPEPNEELTLNFDKS